MDGTGGERREGSARGAKEKKPLECGKKGGRREEKSGAKMAARKWRENGLEEGREGRVGFGERERK